MFQSTLPRRERRRSENHIRYFGRFNPRSHEGSDSLLITPFIQQSLVSIHAPTKGATLITGVCIFLDEFQSTLPRRERLPSLFSFSSASWFQSTLPRRERRFSIIFQRLKIRVSIHAPTKGATKTLILAELDRLVSIHAPTKGATAISAKNLPRFSAETHKLLSVHKLILSFLSSFYHNQLPFVHIFQCESSRIFMSAFYSHFSFITKSAYHPLQFLYRHPYAPLWSDTYSPNNRISDCQHFHR